MARGVVTVDPSTSFKTCMRLMRMHGVGSLPVVSQGRLVGIITVTDLMFREFRPTMRDRFDRNGHIDKELSAATVMSRNVVAITPDAPLVAAVRLMFERQINQLPVVDADGRLVGIISRSDILRVFLRSDLSIRKEISDHVLSELPLVGTGWVKPSVHDGVVTLEGEVEAGTLTEVLLRLVASVPGVVGVHNCLKIKRHAKALKPDTSGRLEVSFLNRLPAESSHRPPPRPFHER